MRKTKGNGRAVAAVLLAVATSAAGPPVSAQAPNHGDGDAMDRLALLVGEWEGVGWIRMGPEGRVGFRGTESVAPRLGGRVLVVEGRFLAPVGPDGEERVVHHALGVLSHDAADGRYSFRTWLANGQGGEFAAEADGESIVWGYEDARMGQVRYTIRITADGRWHEVGDVRRDGDSWTRFFEMTLRRRP